MNNHKATKKKSRDTERADYIFSFYLLIIKFSEKFI